LSVPAALTALLTIGPAYGLQLHSELGARLPHRLGTNVGQIYSTLDRLVRDGTVCRAGETEDGLPLYALTLLGRATANSWLAGKFLTSSSSWTEILDVLLAGSTIADSPLNEACTSVENLYAPNVALNESLSSAAHEHFQIAVLATVDSVRRAARNKVLPIRGFEASRPIRGRRPKKTATD
jgi:DNA-binding PadR family transcriptional regulator